MTTDKRAFTVAEAAAYIGRSPSFIRALKRTNRMPAKRDGKTLLFLREDLDRYLDALPEAEVA